MGQQVTLNKGNAKSVGPRIDLMMERASVGECDLVAHSDTSNGFLYMGNGKFKTNVASTTPVEILITDGALRATTKSGSKVTYTCTPPGSGMRIALDRDEDGARGGDEIAAGTDPADPSSLPAM